MNVKQYTRDTLMDDEWGITTISAMFGVVCGTLICYALTGTWIGSAISGALYVGLVAGLTIGLRWQTP